MTHAVRANLFPSFSLIFILLSAARLGVAQNTSVTTLSVIPQTAQLGQTATLTATISPESATGNVTFYNGAYALGVVPLQNGRAIFSTSLLPSGTALLRAKYDGSFSVASSSSQVVLLQVTAVAESSFRSAVNIPLGAALNNVAIADFNLDGKQDLVAASAFTFYVLLGNGDGTFTQKTSYQVPNGIGSIVVADFNGDGKPDLALTAIGYGNTVQIFLGNGDGTFSSGAILTPAIGLQPGSIIAEDFNRDGQIDLGVLTETGTFLALLGKGDGTFLPSIAGFQSQYASTLAAGDFNDDGAIDLVAGANVYFGNGDGTFYSGVSLGFSATPAVADMDGDGISDIIELSVGTIEVFLSRGDGTFLAPITYTTANNSFINPVINDFNGDGKPDLAVVDSSNNLVDVFINNGGGNLALPVSYNVSEAASAMATGDFNRDGRPDLVVAVNSGLSLLFGYQLSATLLAAVPSPSLTGQPVVLTATVTPSTATGNVVFQDQGSTIGSGAVAQGSAAVTISTLTAGLHNLTAVYSGDVSDGASTSRVLPVWISNQLSSTILSSSQSTPQAGQVVTLSATVTPVTAGFVDFFDGPVLVGEAALSNGQAVLRSAQLAAGSHAFTARFSGTASIGPSSSAVVNVSVASNATGGFEPSVSYTTGTQTAGFVSADFNGDGITDVAVLNYGDYNASILLGNGDGTFTARSLAYFATAPTFIAAFDLDGDGIVDLIVATTAGIVTLRGHGNGTFDGPVTVITNCPPGSIAVGDFNGDGVPDLLIALQPFLANGDGTYRSVPNPNAQSSAPPIVADFNGDGLTDIAVLQECTCVPGPSQLAILFSNGDGTFQSAVISQNVSNSFVLGDFNRDGNPDLAVAAGNSLITFLGSGKGSFTRAFTIQTIEPVGQMAIGDFNGDGKLDIVSAVFQTATLFLGKGDGSFQIGNAYPINFSPGPEALAVLSLDGSGRSDLVYLNSGQTGVNVSLGLPVTTISLQSSSDSIALNQSALLTASVSPASVEGKVLFRDGVNILGSAQISQGLARLYVPQLTAGRRILSATYAGTATAPTAVSPAISVLVSETASAGFVPSGTSYSTGTNPGSIVLADFNNDGQVDLAVGNGDGTISIYLSDGGGLFQSALSAAAGTNIVSLAVCDLNADGRPDILAVNKGAADYDPANALLVLLGSGDGTFLPATTIPVTYLPTSVAVADLNGDGLPDAAVSMFDGFVSLFAGQSDGTLIAFTPSAEMAQNTLAVAIGDFNGDGIPDLVAVNDPLNAPYGAVTVDIGAGDLTFPTQTLGYQSGRGAGNNSSFLTVGDFNNDGRLDVAVANAGNSAQQETGNVSILLGNGNGTLNPAVNFSAGLYPRSLAVVDLNDDGVLDLVVAGSAGVNVLLGNGDGTFQSPVSYASTPASSVVLADLNADNRIDIAFAAAGESTMNVLLDQGAACSVSVPPTPIYALTAGFTIKLPVNVTGSTCAWSASTAASWISLQPSASLGSGSLSITVSPNTGALRNATINIANQIIPVTQWGPTFQDVDPSSYYSTAVNLLASKAITSGCGPELFCPEDAVLRSQMAIFLVRVVVGGDDFTYSPAPYFTDVPAGSFGFQWIQKLYELGITSGCGPGLFCPDEIVTRDQMAVFLIRVRYGATTTFDIPQTPYFSDVPPTAFGFTFIQRLRMDNITSGCAVGLFCPANPVLRGDMAIFLMRAGFNLLLPSLSPLITSSSVPTLPVNVPTAVTITGVNTNFVQGFTQIGTLPGLSASNISVVSPTLMRATLNLSAGTYANPYPIWVITGGEEAILPNALAIP